MVQILEAAKARLPADVKYQYRVMTGQIRLMPDFIIVGAARCGTTSLYKYLTTHPNIGTACKKEVHFFDTNFAKGFNWYRAHFPFASRHYAARIRGERFVTGEASPYYMFHPLAPKRIAEAIPDARLIVLLRDPVERAYSHFHHASRMGFETLSFEEALDREQDRLQGEADKIVRLDNYNSYSHQHHSYLSRGIYVDQLSTLFDLFPRAQVLILRSEDFYAEPAAGVHQVLDFLGLPDGVRRDYPKYNSGDNPDLRPATRQRLVEFYKPHNARLYEFLERDFGW